MLLNILHVKKAGFVLSKQNENLNSPLVSDLLCQCLTLCYELKKNTDHSKGAAYEQMSDHRSIEHFLHFLNELF